MPRLGLRDIVLFNIASVLSLRWLATAARIGPGSLTLWAAAALLFFVPLALVVARLNQRFPEEGGLYAWTGRAFGPWHGFLCGWCYWLSNLFYFPNLLLAGFGIAFTVAGPRAAAWADDRLVMTAASLAALWIALLTNLRGYETGRWTQNTGAIATHVTGSLLTAAGFYVLLRGESATVFHLAPAPRWESLNYWSQIAFAFGGLELGSILSREVRDAGRTIRRAAWISAAAIAAFYIFGTTAMLALLRPEDVNIVSGIAQGAQRAGQVFGLPWLPALLAGLVVFGILGQFGAWIGGSARLAFAIGLDRYLPASFARLHPRHGTPHVAMLSQGAACTMFLLLLQTGENLRAAYQLLVNMTVVAYFIPFLYLFATAWKYGQRLAGFCGAVVIVAGLVFSFVPPEDARSVWLFETKLILGCAALIGAGWLVYRRAATRPRAS